MAFCDVNFPAQQVFYEFFKQSQFGKGLLNNKSSSWVYFHRDKKKILRAVHLSINTTDLFEVRVYMEYMAMKVQANYKRVCGRSATLSATFHPVFKELVRSASKEDI